MHAYSYISNIIQYPQLSHEYTYTYAYIYTLNINDFQIARNQNQKQEMEVYSIINDLHQIDLNKPQLLLTRQALIRNKYLLRKYSKEFKNSGATDFIRKVRRVSKQTTFINNKENRIVQRLSCPWLSFTAYSSKDPIPSNLTLKLNFLSNSNSQRREYGAKSLQRTQLQKTTQSVHKMAKSGQAILKCTRRLFHQEENCQNLQYYDQKIKSYLNSRYKNTVARLKNWYCNPKQSGSLGNPQSCLINYSLAEYISKNIAKH